MLAPDSIIQKLYDKVFTITFRSNYEDRFYSVYFVDQNGQLDDATKGRELKTQDEKEPQVPSLQSE